MSISVQIGDYYLSLTKGAWGFAWEWEHFEDDSYPRITIRFAFLYFSVLQF